MPSQTLQTLQAPGSFDLQVECWTLSALMTLQLSFGMLWHVNSINSSLKGLRPLKDLPLPSFRAEERNQTPVGICSGCTPHKEPHLRAHWTSGRCLISWKNVCTFIITLLSPHVSDFIFLVMILQQMAVEYIILTNSAYYNNFLTNESKISYSNRIDIFFF